MDTYDFSLLFALDAEEDAEGHLESLLGNGCHDATISTGRKGFVHLDFGREASSMDVAVPSAVADVMRAVPHARLVDAPRPCQAAGFRED